MRLINVQDYSLVEVEGPGAYPYAILSHTWSTAGEVTLDDMKDLATARSKSEWPKVQHTCALAQSQGISFVWIDTCCIDKSSSAELTEAINSMFEWYGKAETCYAYLSDLAESPTGDPESDRGKQQLGADLRACRWFTRGWTLQELIAPGEVEFYDKSWTQRGTKASMRHEIASITAISDSVLSNSDELSTIPVARKMSWAAKRHTTRVEDTAYCLLGIFGVNLPLVYGEGARAFIRLQEAIAQSTNDLSLFAWFEDAHSSSPQTHTGVLAQSPRQFASESCRRLELIADPLSHDATTFTITNRGVEFQTSLIMDFDTGDYLMHLDCRDPAIRLPEGPGVIAIRLAKTSSGFARHHAGSLHVDAADGSANPASPTLRKWDPCIRPVHVPQVISPAQSTRLRGRLSEAFQFKVDTPRGVMAELATQGPGPAAPGSLRPSYWDPAASMFLTEGYEYFTGMAFITFSSHPDDPLVILCGLMPPASASPGRPQGAVDSPRAPPEPWVALHPLEPLSSSKWRGGYTPEPPPPAQHRVDDLQALISEGSGMHYPRFLARLGQAIRARVRTGRALLPTVALMKYRQRGDQDGGTPPPPRYRRVTVSVATRRADRVHEVRISLEDQLSSAGVSEQLEQGITHPRAPAPVRSPSVFDIARRIL